MENLENVLKPSKQKITLTGKLKEKNFNLGTSEKGDYISGKIVVTVGDDSDVVVQLFANKMVKDKQTQQPKENPLYNNYLAIMNEYLSAAEIADKGLTDKVPTVVNVRGASFERNDYFNKKTSAVVEGVVVKATAVSQTSENQIVPQAEFEITAYLQKIANEVKDGLETGRKKCTLLFPVYGGKLASMTVMCNELVSSVLDVTSVGQTYTFVGAIKNITTEVKKVTPGLAGNIERTFKNTTREYLISNILMQPNGTGAIDETSEQYLAPAAINVALSDREATLEQMKQSAEAAW